MKKEYIKPLMESEMFVSNEYIAACWYVKCKVKKDYPDSSCIFDSFKYLIYGSDLKTATSKEYDFMHIGNTGLLHNTLEGYEDPSKYYHKTSFPGLHHEVYFEEKGNGSSSNAS